jgi:hypothetical protein
MFNAVIRAYFEFLTANQPSDESVWYAPWDMLLNSLFPSEQGYAVRPQSRILSNNKTEYIIPDFILEVVKITTSPLTTRIVLIVEIKNTGRWPDGINTLTKQIIKQADHAFDQTARHEVYCIQSIGPHWRYFHKLDTGIEEDINFLCDWHHNIHDAESYDGFVSLKRLIDRI